MYQEGQQLIIKAIEAPYSKIFSAPIAVTVIDETDEYVWVRLNADDAAKLWRDGRDVMRIIKHAASPDWAIEIVETPAPAPAVETPATQAAHIWTRDEWNRVHAVYGANMPEDSYEAYLAKHAPALPTYTVQLPDTGWYTEGNESSVVANEKIADGQWLEVTIVDKAGVDEYIIVEAVIIDADNRIVGYVDWDRIKLLGYDGTERRTTFSDTWGVMTAAEAAKRFGLAEATVRQAIHRGQLPARKSGGTWIVRRKDAEARWGKRAR